MCDFLDRIQRNENLEAITFYQETPTALVASLAQATVPLRAATGITALPARLARYTIAHQGKYVRHST